MPLNLRDKLLQELTASLTEQLPNLLVHNATYLSFRSMDSLTTSQALLPQSGEIHKRIASVLGEFPLVEFVAGTISNELDDNYEFASTPGTIPLISLPEYQDAAAFADRLVRAFNDLPNKYTMTVRLPSAMKPLVEKEGTFRLSDALRVQSGKGALQFAYPLTTGNKLRDRRIARHDDSLLSIFRDEPAVWDHDAIYLQIDVEGFISRYGAGETFDSAVSTLRSFYGLAIAIGLFQVGTTYNAGTLDTKRAFIHRETKNGYVAEQCLDLSPELSDIIASLGSNADALMEQGTSLLGAVFAAGDRSRRIRLAGQWLLDSYAGKDELLRFVQAAVVIEILLGEEEKAEDIGLSALLANRCAYLIADTHSERVQLLADFKRIYDVRSKIVHRGKSRLSGDERYMLGKLRRIAIRILQREIMLLVKDVERPEGSNVRK